MIIEQNKVEVPISVQVVTFNRPKKLRVLISAIICQTFENWSLHVVHDGPSEDAAAICNSFSDDRIHYYETETVNGAWGHPNRDWALSLMDGEYMLFTNDDNYYVPEFMERLLNKAQQEGLDFVYCDMVHNHQNYQVLRTEPRRCHIDMGAFLVKTALAKQVGFKDYDYCGDGVFVEKVVASGARIGKAEGILFVHN